MLPSDRGEDQVELDAVAKDGVMVIDEDDSFCHSPCKGNRLSYVMVPVTRKSEFLKSTLFMVLRDATDKFVFYTEIE